MASAMKARRFSTAVTMLTRGAGGELAMALAQYLVRRAHAIGRVHRLKEPPVECSKKPFEQRTSPDRRVDAFPGADVVALLRHRAQRLEVCGSPGNDDQVHRPAIGQGHALPDRGRALDQVPLGLRPVLESDQAQQLIAVAGREYAVEQLRRKLIEPV